MNLQPPVCGGFLYTKEYVMRVFLFVGMFCCWCVSVKADEIFYWNPRVMSNVLNNSYNNFLITKKQSECLSDLCSNTIASTLNEFNVDCVGSLLNCGKSVDEEKVYSVCAQLSIDLMEEQERYFDECQKNKEQAKKEFGVCAVEEGARCNSGKTVMKHQSTIPGTAYDKLKLQELREYYLCESGFWKKEKNDETVEKYPDVEELKAFFMYGKRCFYMQRYFDEEKGEEVNVPILNNFIDCDIEQQKCMFLTEYDTVISEKEKNRVWIHCCKLHGDFSVSLYEAFVLIKNFDEVMQHGVDFYDFCNKPSWDEE